MERDLIKGLADFPFTLNEYGYCWNNPLMLADRNGAWPEFIENAVEWGKEHKGAVVAAVGVAALAVAAAAFAPVVLAGGAAAGVTVGIMAKVAMLGGTAGSLLDIVYQKMQIDNSERDSFNGYEIAICFLTGAAGAITGPGGASLMAVANYVGIEIVNDNMPGEFETIINGVWGYIGGVMAAKMSSKFESILGRKVYAITNSSGVLTKTYLIEEYGKKYSAKMMAGVFKALLVTNPWHLEKSIDSGNFLIHEITLFTDLIQNVIDNFVALLIKQID